MRSPSVEQQSNMARKVVTQHFENVQRQDFVRHGVTGLGQAAVAVPRDRAFEALLGSMAHEGGESSFLL